MPASSTNVEDLVQQSKLVFVGTVRRLNASTLAALPPDDRMAVVRVDQVLQTPPGFALREGGEITVGLKRSGGVRPGQQLVFFTNGWLMGESIAVQEVAHRSAEAAASVTRMRNRVSGAVADMQDTNLDRHIATGDAVVVGTVTEVRDAPGPDVAGAGDQGPRFSEHDPQWRQAVIQVSNVVTGDVNTQEPVTVMFPGSDDIMWYKAPKFQQGQEGVFVLHRDQVRDLAAGRHGDIGERAMSIAEQTGAYTALDPMDVHSLGDLERISASVQRRR